MLNSGNGQTDPDEDSNAELNPEESILILK